MNGKNTKPNRLIKEKSPYLLQHANNPVDWFPWGEEALSKAKQENKPILVSIGYATCHWCHVMEMETFEDPAIAEILNSKFIPIKVDREERPDIDSIYMDALQAMEEQGGWPLNMFLTPDTLPIAGGTYFPPEPRYGRKSFKEILSIIHNAWETRRDEIQKSGENLLKFLISIEESENKIYFPDTASFTNGCQIYKNYYDKNNYGFKTNTQNKFPPSIGLSYLLNYYYFSKDEFALEMVESTLIAIKKGGIYDQIGGGLSRYSTDHFWLVPHFEKMLYDNSLYLFALVECYSLTKKNIYKEISYDIIRYIDRDMRLSEHGISSAEDADSEGEEGKFYVWSYDEIKPLLGENADLLLEFWNITPEGNFEGKNILNESINIDFIKKYDLIESEWNEILISVKQKILNVRSSRVRPLRDDKVLTSWNALYITSLAYAGRIFSDNELVFSAESTYRFLYNNLFKNGRLLRSWRDGESSVKGYLNDYAELANAGVELYKSTFKFEYLNKAYTLTRDVIKLFDTEKGVYYSTGSDAEKLIRRSIDSYDSVEPSGNSTFSLVLQKLSLYGYDYSDFTSRTENIFKYYKKELEIRPLSSSFLLKSYLYYLETKFEIILISKEKDEFSDKIIHFFQTSHIPNLAFCFLLSSDFGDMKEKIPFLQGKHPEDPYTLYICKETICEAPQFTKESIISKLTDKFPLIGL
jgi:uncharacterized protein YyaL (SSP411 family)